MQKRSLNALLIGLAVLAVVIVGAVLLPTPIDTAVVEQQLQRFSQRLTAEVPDAKFVYEGVQVKGFFFGKHAVVMGPKVVVGSGAEEVTIAATQAQMTPKSRDFSANEMVIPSPVTATLGGTKVADVSYTPPLKVHVAREGSGNNPTYTSRVELPSDITFRGQAFSQPSPEQNWQSVHILLGRDSELRSKSDVQGAARESAVHISHATVTSGENNRRATLAEFNATNTNVALDGRRRKVTYDIAMKDLLLPEDVNPFGPLSLTVQSEYVGEVPATPSAPMIGLEASLNLRTFVLATRDFTVRANAQLAASKTELMPTGRGTLDVDHFDVMVKQLRDRGLLQPNGLAVVSSVVLRATGKKLEEVQNLHLEFHRDAGQKMMIGNASLEEILAGAVNPAAGASTPIPPVAAPGSPPAPAPTVNAPAAKPAPAAAAAPAPVVTTPPVPPSTPAPATPVDKAAAPPIAPTPTAPGLTPTPPPATTPPAATLPPAKSETQKINPDRI